METTSRRNLVVPFPTMRVRDTIRVTAVVELVCLNCRHVAPLDVIALATKDGFAVPMKTAIKGLACPAHGGGEWVRFQAHGAPPLPYYELRISHVVEPACEIVARCWACHRSRTLDPFALVRKRSVGPDAVLVELEERLRCEGCGQRGWTKIRLRC